MKFTFQGPPIAKMRHQYKMINGKFHNYDKQHAEASSAKIQLMAQISKESIEKRTEMAHAEAFDVILMFYLPVPKKLNTAQIKAIQDGTGIEHANTKPDLDNLIKFYLDVANGILYKDDKQIVCLKSMKMYSLNPRTEFIITPHKGIP